MTSQRARIARRQARSQTTLSRPKPEQPDDTLLELYSYFKQATEGDVSGTRPGAFDFVARAKYDAWLARKGVKKDAAMRAYVKLVEHLQSL